MPIPLILGGLALVAGGLGAGAALNAKDTLKDAESINKNVQEVTDRAVKRCDKHRQQTERSIEALGKGKIAILDGNMKMFVRVFSKLKNVNFRDSVGMKELADFTPQSEYLGALKQDTLTAADVSSGIAGVAAGAATAGATYLAVGALGTASTGFAIGELSGVAATNATLAWLGGGSIAAGGLGMTVGTAVLGGLVAGPAILVAGFFMDSKADKVLAEVKANREKAKVFIEESNNMCVLLDAIKTRAEQIEAALVQLDRKFGSSIRTMVQIIARKGTNWNSIPVADKKRIGEAAMLAKTIKVIMDTPLLHEDGTLNEATEQMLANVSLLKA